MTAFAILLLSLFYLYLFILAIRVLFVPLALAHEVRQRRVTMTEELVGERIAVVVPAFNEAKVIRPCLESILTDEAHDLEVVVVDDGSTDDTATIVHQMCAAEPRLRLITQENAGKGAALNRGFNETSAEILLFIDADSVFTDGTIDEMLRGFHSPRVGAVCGDDRPVNLDRVLTRFLALITHLGTGLVRRAFDVLGCVPVVSGNSGAFRRSALEAVSIPGRGPLREDTVGEDLELTWRLHRTDWKVSFAPRALVLAESPSTIRALWRQRVRWSRGLLQSLRLHWSAMVKPKYGTFSGLIAFTIITMVIVPILQVTTFLGVLITGLVSGMRGGAFDFGLPGTVWGWLLATGLLVSVSLLLVSMVLGRGLADLRHIWTLPLWPIYSMALNFVFLRALTLEVVRARNSWQKAERTGSNSFVKAPAIA